ncbi:MAG TPA: hypothetical protein VMH39_06020 [Gemmatimonadaceae bacterium]|nr:hypothetical protein [Gemmatimonadaceae bacterium]
MKPSTAALILAALAALFSIAVQTARLDHAQTAAIRAGLSADTLVASRDTTRVLSIRLAALGDSLAVVQRRALQVDQRADALDRALGLARAAHDSLVASIASYRGVVQTTPSGSTRGDRLVPAPSSRRLPMGGARTRTACGARRSISVRRRIPCGPRSRCRRRPRPGR